MTTIGLCMIVKNEERVIERCLDSVRPIIDYVLVCDTGSTDNTKSRIFCWFDQEQVPGRILDHDWTDFATNRSLALHHLRHGDYVDYALMMDADDQLVIDPDLDVAAFKASLTADMYDVLIEHGAINHWRPQIFSNRKEFRYRGVVHEFVEGPTNHTRGRTEGIKVLAGTEGSRSNDTAKYYRDAKLLETALATETDEVMRQRYMFYLAQSWKDAGMPVPAIAMYLKRADRDGWPQEVYVSLLRAAQLMEGTAAPSWEIVATYLRAYEVDPSRAEALQSVTRYCQRTGHHNQGYLIGKHGITIPQPTDQKLFLEPWVYEWGVLDDFSVAAYWSGHYAEALEAAERALKRAPPEHHQRIVDNVRFAKEKLTAGNYSTLDAELEPPPFITKIPPSNFTVVTEDDVDLTDEQKQLLANVKEIKKREHRPIDFTVVAAELPGYTHSGAYAELAETVLYGLRALGYTAELRHDQDWATLGGRIIVVGAHLIVPELAEMKDSLIIYNTEHYNNLTWSGGGYVSLLRRHPGQIWDYNEENTRKLTEVLGRPVKYVPIGYAPELTRITSAAEQDIDVLFYGSINGRREKIIDDLRAAGLTVEVLFGVYGAERDAYIARAKVVLCMHYYTPGVFETVRVSYLLANGKAVVCEVNEGEKVPVCLPWATVQTKYEGLVDACKNTINNDIERRRLESDAFKFFSNKHESTILRSALRRRVWDCFLYNGEIDALKIRINELKDVVNRFVIVEADTTFSGQKKSPQDLWAGTTGLVSLYDMVNGKIEHIVVTDMPETDNPWERERHQRNAIMRGLADAAPDDLIMISDVDEIPRATVVEEMANDHQQTAFGLRLAFNYFLLNYRCTSGPEANKIWNCAIIKEDLDKTTPDALRYAVKEGFFDDVIDNAGWHFSYLGDDEAVRSKIRAFSHQEYNTPEVLANVDLNRMVRNGEDLFGRPGYGWRLVGTDDLPEWVKSQPEMMERWTR